MFCRAEHGCIAKGCRRAQRTLGAWFDWLVSPGNSFNFSALTGKGRLSSIRLERIAKAGPHGVHQAHTNVAMASLI